MCIIIDTELCLERGVDTRLTSHLDEIIKSQQHISEVNRDERTFIIGPNGGGAGTTILDILMTFTISDVAAEDISSYKGISKEEYTSKFVKLHEELENTRPELSICRFWAKKDF